MAISSDLLIERAKIRRQLSFWRLLSIAAITIFMIVLIQHEKKNGTDRISGDYIARVEIDGVITDDRKMLELLERLRDNDRVKAVILSLNTPGGTAVGGENLYRMVGEIKKKKPVVATMGSLCASAGYMVAMQADRVYAMHGTITASIGVILQSFEATGLADKLGITPVIVKSGPLKGSPNPLEKVTPASHAELQHLVDNFFQTFKKMVAESRHLSDAEVEAIADGRVVSGDEAVRMKLVDAIGGEEEALDWLHQARKIGEDIPVKESKPKEEESDLIERFAKSTASNLIPEAFSNLKLDGLLLIWQPALSK